MKVIRQANAAERIDGWADKLRGFPAGAAYVCLHCGSRTEFPQPTSPLDSFVPDEIRQQFDLETKARRISHTSAVDLHCSGCLRPVRILFDHHEDNRSLDSWSIAGGVRAG